MNQTELWATSSGFRGVVIRYDQGRYQLRLMREQGTVKADLFHGYASALEAARERFRQVDATNAPFHTF